MADDSLIVQKRLKQSVEQQLVVVQKHFAHAEALVTYMDRCAFES